MCVGEDLIGVKPLYKGKGISCKGGGATASIPILSRVSSEVEPDPKDSASLKPRDNTLKAIATLPISRNSLKP